MSVKIDHSVLIPPLTVDTVNTLSPYKNIQYSKGTVHQAIPNLFHPCLLKAQAKYKKKENKY